MTERTLAIVDNDSWVLSAMTTFFSKHLDGMPIIWTASGGQAALEHMRTGPRPDVLLVDMSMDDMPGIEVIRRIRRYDAATAIVAMTAFPPERYAAAAAQAGAQALVGKRYPQHVADTVELAAAGVTGEDVDGVTFLPVGDAYRIVSAERRIGIDALSPAELQIVELCSQGLTSVEIARHLGKAQATVNTHLQRALEKSGARNRTHLVAMWMQAQY